MTVKAKPIASLVLGATLLFTGGTTSSGQTLASFGAAREPIVSVGDAKPLPAWSGFCQRHPAECVVDRSEPAIVTLSAKTIATISAVNRRVNAAITPVTDADHWGVADRWDIPTDGYGDCEDYQLLKRKLLADAGLPRRAMRMTVVIDEKNEGHAVLIVKTDRGDLTLDNKHDNVLPWQDTGYVFVKRESQDEIGWVSLGRAVSPVATAKNR